MITKIYRYYHRIILFIGKNHYIKYFQSLRIIQVKFDTLNMLQIHVLPFELLIETQKQFDYIYNQFFLLCNRMGNQLEAIKCFGQQGHQSYAVKKSKKSQGHILKKQAQISISKEIFNSKYSGKGDEKLFGNDNRVKIEDIYNFPYSAIGLISMIFNGQRAHGTGFLVSDNLVMTCAHNCYDYITKCKAQKMVFLPGLEMTIGRQFNVTEIYYPTNYEKCGEYQFDFAIVKLEKAIGQSYGWFGLDFNQNKEYIDIAQISGYPGMVIQNKKQENAKGIQFSARGQLTQNGNILKYTISTSPGQSGSPIFFGQSIAVGIHTGGETYFNVGVSLNQYVRKKLNKWCGDIWISVLVKFPNDQKISFKNLVSDFTIQEMEEIILDSPFSRQLNITNIFLEFQDQRLKRQLKLKDYNIRDQSQINVKINYSSARIGIQINPSKLNIDEQSEDDNKPKIVNLINPQIFDVFYGKENSQDSENSQQSSCKQQEDKNQNKKNSQDSERSNQQQQSEEQQSNQQNQQSKTSQNQQSSSDSQQSSESEKSKRQVGQVNMVFFVIY